MIGRLFWIANDDGSRLHDRVPVNSLITTPGIRALGIETWLDDQRVALAMDCGTGYVCHYIADVESGASWNLCSSTGFLKWSANKKFAVVSMLRLVTGVTFGFTKESQLPRKNG